MKRYVLIFLILNALFTNKTFMPCSIDTIYFSNLFIPEENKFINIKINLFLGLLLTICLLVNRLINKEKINLVNKYNDFINVTKITDTVEYDNFDKNLIERNKFYNQIIKVIEKNLIKDNNNNNKEFTYLFGSHNAHIKFTIKYNENISKNKFNSAILFCKILKKNQKIKEFFNNKNKKINYLKLEITQKINFKNDYTIYNLPEISNYDLIFLNECIVEI